MIPEVQHISIALISLDQRRGILDLARIALDLTWDPRELNTTAPLHQGPILPRLCQDPRPCPRRRLERYLVVAELQPAISRHRALKMPTEEARIINT